MLVEDITDTLHQLFGDAVDQSDDAWQVDTEALRLLVLLSVDKDWLRVLVPIVAAETAQPFWEQLLAANFDRTLEVRYAVHQQVLWGVFQHSLAGLTRQDLTHAIQQLTRLHAKGLDDCFQDVVEQRVRQIIQAAKQQGQSLELTLQTLDRFYQEGLLGSMAQDSQEREATLAAWRYQLERLWHDITPEN